MPPKPLRLNLTGLSHEDKDRLIDALFARLDAVEAKLGMDSENSSKPPSSDGLAKKQKTTSLRGKSDKTVGGQPGHKGSTLKRVAEPTSTQDHPTPSHCNRCHSALAFEEAHVLERRQVFDVPTMCFEVVEHRVYTVLCTCGQRHDSVFPSAVSDLAQYGPNVRALGVHLTQGQMLPYARAAELIRELIARQLHHAPVLCADESGLRVDGKLHWMHVAATAELTWYGMHAKRGLEAIAAHGILPNRLGVLVHDCWAPYWKLNDGLHALCNAHLLRELVYAQEVTGQDWPTDMTELLLNAQRLSAAARQQGKPFDADAIAAFATVYHGIVRRGEELNPPQTKPGAKPGRCKQSEAHNLLRRFRLHADAILRFIADPTVPFTNNIAERAVRMPKVKQKISGCFRTIVGADNFCTIRSCLDTLRKQGHSMLEVLRRAFAGDPIRPAA